MALVLDDFGKLALQKYLEVLAHYNEQVLRSKSVDSKEDFAEHFMQNAPELAEFNEKIEKIENLLEQTLSERLIAATPLIEPAYEAAVASAGVNPEALKQERSTVTATAKYLTSMYGDEILADTPKIETLRGSGGGGGGGGGRRIRGFDVYIDGVLAYNTNKDGEKKSTFSAAAKELEVDTTVLQRAFFDAAGSEDVKSDSFPSVVEFEFEDKSGEVHNIRAAKVDDSGDE